MALFKPFRGTRASLPQELHDGYAYFCTDDGSFHIDYTDADGNLHRKQINAKDCESVLGLTLEQIQKSISWNDLLDRPFGYEAEVETPLTVERTFTDWCLLTNATDSWSTLSKAHSDGCIVKVYYDDEVYLCTAETGGSGFILVSDTELPFTATEAVAGSDGSVKFTALDGGTHTVLITRVDTEVVKVPEEYIPDTIARVGDMQDAINSNQPIIDVAALPTENINEKAFYRTSSGSLVRDQIVYSGYTCHCVESLPSVGLPATDVDPDLYPDQPVVSLYRTSGDLYYTVADAALYGYADDTVSTRLGLSVGWHPVSDIFGAVDHEYVGVITALVDDPADGKFRLLLDYTVYSYKDGWASHKVIGRAGVGAFSEAFNHPSSTASGDYSHAEGYYTCASENAAHVEGMYTYASDTAGHAEGYYTYAEGYAGHTEGSGTYAKGSSSHAEGHGYQLYVRLTGAANSTTYTIDDISRIIVGVCVRYELYVDDVLTYNVANVVSFDAENSTITLNKTLSADTNFDNESVELFVAGMAIGDYSHAEGNQTIAACQSQHTEGEFNLIDPEFDVNNNKRGKYAHIVGNGTHHTERSNAHTLDWSGNAWFAGDVYIGGDSQDDGAEKLVTQTEVSAKIAEALGGGATPGVGAVQPDMSQNNGDQPDYIKNRTHWKESLGVQVLFDGTVETVDGRNVEQGNPIAFEVEPNKTYTVVYDGTTYEVVSKVDYYDIPYIGSNTLNANIPYDSKEEPFSYGDGYFGASTDGTHTVVISTEVFEYHTIEEKYLPGVLIKRGEGLKSEIFNSTRNQAKGVQSHAEGDLTVALGDFSHAEGARSVSYGDASHAEGLQGYAKGYASHAEGKGCNADGNYSHAEGDMTKATGNAAHAEGDQTEASGSCSHAEGYDTVASGARAHAEGYQTVASGYQSHTEGYKSQATTTYTHAEGYCTIAASKTQHVQGKYNIADTEERYAHIVGNGLDEDVTNGSGAVTTQNRSNAHTLDWSGNAWFAGDIRIGGTGYDDGISLLPKCTTITLSKNSWSGKSNPWSQTVTMNGVTANSKLDLLPTATQIVELQSSEITLMLQNDSGIVTAWAIGNKPTESLTMQVLITEVIPV